MEHSSRNASATRSINFHPRRRSVIGGKLNMKERVYRSKPTRGPSSRTTVSTPKPAVLQTLVILLARAAAAQHPPAAQHLSLEIDPLAAFFANHPRPLESRQVFRSQFYSYVRDLKECFIRQLRVGPLLSRFLFQFREHFPGALLRGFLRRDPHRAAGLQVHKGRRHFAPVPELQGAFP